MKRKIIRAEPRKILQDTARRKFIRRPARSRPPADPEDPIKLGKNPVKHDRSRSNMATRETEVEEEEDQGRRGAVEKKEEEEEEEEEKGQEEMEEVNRRGESEFQI